MKNMPLETLFSVFADISKIKVAELDVPGNAIRIYPDLSGKNQLYFSQPKEKVLISVSPETAAALSSDFLGQCTLGELASRFEGWELEDRYPHLIKDDDQIIPYTYPPGFEVRSIDPGDKEATRSFLTLNSDSDIDDAMIDVDDPDEEIRIAYFGKVLVAYAGYRVWQKGLADVGILVRPDFRGRGVGTSLVAEVTAACIKNGRVPLWRTWDKNPGSLKVALNNGYRLIWKTEIYQWERLSRESRYSLET